MTREANANEEIQKMKGDGLAYVSFVEVHVAFQWSESDFL